MSTPYNYGNIETPTYSDAQKSILPLNAMVAAVEALTTAVGLRGYIGVRQMVAWVQGSATVNDGGAGQFHWSPTSTTADDGGTTSIAPIGPAGTAIATGRWLRDTSLSSDAAILLPANGGTGVANANASTITLGGALTTSGAFATTLTTTAATTVTLPLTGVLVGPVNSIAYKTNTTTVGATLSATNCSGGQVLTALYMTGTLGGAANAQLPTVAALVAAIPGCVAGQTYVLRFANQSSANFAWTITTNTGWTLAGTVAVAQNVWTDFLVTFTTLSAATFQNIGSGTVT